MRPSYTRPYDVAMAPDLRAAVKERRKNPDGKLLPVKVTGGPDNERFEYPWAEMRLGDFFFVPLRGRAPDKVAVRFRQVAARRDWELSISTHDRDKEPCLRVVLSLLDVAAIKKRAQTLGTEGIRISDGRWQRTRMLRYHEQKAAPAKVQKSKLPKNVIPLHPKLVHASDQGSPAPELGVDATLSPDYNRDAIMADRIAKLQGSPHG